ncbi:MarR family winged helix-turn-helix transcriptional regulator [Pseudacidovorax sp. RU35E]|jgi:DNA-binding MarR family transcriptional regulator|uniref:MarR family winged helix-turn-helix transcriptional regulator n=1 Tax=Pseudacidovorax sp. RU35E TaxID=1907403 RepID=UPI00095719A5|nr:MarR family winged helix-turn-helix transcriptional regulator [Pseudacidovorax sp. RU35E]SIR77711.1 DNA-binding transcriptional regulator, MarR family [Pseudacidovorax sp. RU35E]
MPTPKPRSRKPVPAATTAADPLDSHVLESLVGYNTRRAYLVVYATFAERMAVYGLKPTDFSVLSLLAHNPGATSRQLCAALDIQPPNFVSLVAAMDRRGLIERRPHPHDGRAVGLHLTDAGHQLMAEAEEAVIQLEKDASHKLTDRERDTLIRLLQKIYL